MDTLFRAAMHEVQRSLTYEDRRNQGCRCRGWLCFCEVNRLCRAVVAMMKERL